MKKKIIALLAISSIASINSDTYLIGIDKKFKPYYKVDTNKIWNESSSTFTEWLNINIPYDFSLYLPEITSQTETFNQTQTFKQDQQQFEQKRQFEEILKIYQDIGEPIEHNQTITGDNVREVEVISEDWTLVGGLINCLDWSPLEETVLFGEEFTQSRQCEQERNRNIAYYIESNLEITLPFSETSLVVEEQQAFGTNASTGWILADSSFSDWINDGEGYDHSEWSPDIIDQLEDFVQLRSYLQKQLQDEQSKEQNTFTLEYRNVGEVVQHQQIISENEERTINVSLGDWNDEGEKFNCLDFKPLPETIEYGQEFTQNANCDQEQIATISYQFEEDILDTSITNQIINRNFEKIEIGINSDNGWNPISSTYTSWIDNGNGYNYSNWSPSISLQENNFIQEQNYSQNKKQTEQFREQNSYTNEIRNTSETMLHEQTTTETNNRTVNVIVGNWTNTGNIYDCDTFTPSSSSYYINETFNQIRNCNQDQTASLTYKVSNSTIDTKNKNQTISVQDSQIENGTKKHTYRVTSDGYDAPKLGGHIYFDNYHLSASRSWAMVVVNTNDYSIYFSGKYDLYGNVASATTFNNDMNNIPNGYLTLITTWDEPCNNANLVFSNLESYFGASLRHKLDCNSGDEIRSAYYLVAYKNGSKLEENWEARYGAGIDSGIKELN